MPNVLDGQIVECFQWSSKFYWAATKCQSTQTRNRGPHLIFLLNAPMSSCKNDRITYAETCAGWIMSHTFFFLVTRSRPGFHKTKAQSGPLPEALICSHSSREFSFHAPFPDKPQLLHGDTTSLWSPSEWARFYCKHLLPQLPPFSYGHAHSPWELVLCHYNSHFPALQVYLLFLPSSCFCSFIFELSHCVRCTTERFNAYGVVRWWALWVGLWFSSVRLFHYFL